MKNDGRLGHVAVAGAGSALGENGNQVDWNIFYLMAIMILGLSEVSQNF